MICRQWAPVETILRALAPELNAAGNPVKNYVEVETTLPSWIKQLDGSTFGKPDSVLQGHKHGDVLATLKPLYQASRGFLKNDMKYEFGTKDNSNTESGSRMKIDLQETWDGILTVRGIILGKVKRVSQRISEGTISREVFEMGGWQHCRRPGDSMVYEMADQLGRSLVANQGFDRQQPPSYFRRSCLYALQRENISGDVNIQALVDHEQTPEVVSAYLRKVQNIIRFRKTFLGGKKKELFGFGSEDIREGRDHICIIYGFSVPVVLRKVKGIPPKIAQRRPEPRTARSMRQPTRSVSYNHFSTTSDSSPEPAPASSRPEIAEAESREYWRLIGECYVDGRMDGEAIHNQHYLENERDFVLI